MEGKRLPPFLPRRLLQIQGLVPDEAHAPQLPRDEVLLRGIGVETDLGSAEHDGNYSQKHAMAPYIPALNGGGFTAPRDNSVLNSAKYSGSVFAPSVATTKSRR